MYSTEEKENKKSRLDVIILIMVILTLIILVLLIYFGIISPLLKLEPKIDAGIDTFNTVAKDIEKTTEQIDDFISDVKPAFEQTLWTLCKSFLLPDPKPAFCTTLCGSAPTSSSPPNSSNPTSSSISGPSGPASSSLTPTPKSSITTITSSNPRTSTTVRNVNINPTSSYITANPANPITANPTTANLSSRKSTRSVRRSTKPKTNPRTNHRNRTNPGINRNYNQQLSNILGVPEISGPVDTIPDQVPPTSKVRNPARPLSYIDSVL